MTAEYADRRVCLRCGRIYEIRNEDWEEKCVCGWVFKGHFYDDIQD